MGADEEVDSESTPGTDGGRRLSGGSAELPLDANTPREKTQGHCRSPFNRPKTEASNIRTTVLNIDERCASNASA
jgi:hypothetical protein